MNGGISDQAVIVNDGPSNAAHQALKAIDDNDNNANAAAALTRPTWGTRDQPELLLEHPTHAIRSTHQRSVAKPTTAGLRTT